MHRLAISVLSIALIAAACGGGSDPAVGQASPTISDVDATPTETFLPSSTTTTQPTEDGEVSLPGNLPFVTASWNTDWSRTTIDLAELLIGISAPDPRDRIAPIDEPQFESPGAAAGWITEREPGLLFEFGGTARFYPLAILTLHEIVNDVAGDVPIAVTYCPLCNTGVVFDRRIDGTTHRFGVSGLLRNSDLVMWDDVTESLWQQITGEGIVGAHAGTNLEILPASLVRFGDFLDRFPDGEVLSRDTGFGYPYGLNPYEAYSSRDAPFPFFRGELDRRYPALERVVGVTIGGTSKAYPFSEISPLGAVDDVVGGEPIVVFWGAADTADALDSGSIAASEGVGTGVAYSRIVDGETLTFEAVDDTTFRDLETGTTWSILGEGLDGPLADSSLRTVVHRNEFWFAWTAFFPDAEVFTG